MRLYHSSKFQIAVLFSLIFFSIIVINNENLKPKTNVLIHRRDEIPFFNKIHSFDCSSFIDRFDQDYYLKAKLETRKISGRGEIEISNLLTNCSLFRSQFFFPRKANTEYEESYPIAYFIRMYQQSERLIKLVHSIYAPQNIYCIHVDKKSDRLIHENIQRFSECLPNVIITQSIKVFWSASSTIISTMSCIKDLYYSGHSWNYVVILEENDVPVRTNFELVYVLKELYQTANDADLTFWPWYWNIKERKRQNKINEFRFNGHSKSSSTNLEMYKGLPQCMLHRKFVEFVLTDQRAIDFLDYLIRNVIFADEAYFTSLIHNDKLLDAPGSFPGRCVNDSYYKSFISRHSVWKDQDMPYSCQKDATRHHICLWGLQNLTAAVHTTNSFFINKFHPSYEPLAFECMREYLFNKSYLEPRVDELWYLSAVEESRNNHINDSAVQYRLWREKHPDVDSDLFNCR